MKLSELRGEIKRHKDDHFSCMSGFNAEKKKLGLTYHFLRGKKQVNLTMVFDEKDTVPSVADIIPSASIYETEAHEMFGIKFDKLERTKLFLSDDWKQKPPLRE